MKKTRQEKGITLIALIITIVVLLILAVVTINAIQGDGIIEYASNAADDYTAKANEEQEKIDTLLAQIEGNLHSGVIPEGATYKTVDLNGKCPICYFEFTSNSADTCDCKSYSRDDIGSSQTLTTGDSFPKTLKHRDTYTYGDYTYIYYKTNEGSPIFSTTGWCVNEVTDKSKTEYGLILESINGQPVTSMYETFIGCTQITDLSDFVIPNCVKEARGVFRGCTQLTNIPKLPSDVRLVNAFWGCTSLDNVVLLDTINDPYLSATFIYCENLTTITIPNTITSINEMTFGYCESLTNIIYKGTIEEWNNIYKWEDGDAAWNSGCGEITVTCNDGTVIVPANN